MKKLILLLIVMFSMNVTSAQFKKAAEYTDYPVILGGTMFIREWKTELGTIYTYSDKDSKYEVGMVKIDLGDKESAINFFENCIATIDEGKAGDVFQLEDDISIVYDSDILHGRYLKVYSGSLGEYFIVNKYVARSAIKRLQKL